MFFCDKNTVTAASLCLSVSLSVNQVRAVHAVRLVVYRVVTAGWPAGITWKSPSLTNPPPGRRLSGTHFKRRGVSIKDTGCQLIKYDAHQLDIDSHTTTRKSLWSLWRDGGRARRALSTTRRINLRHTHTHTHQGRF